MIWFFFKKRIAWLLPPNLEFFLIHENTFANKTIHLLSYE